jgi:hypothetical protein
MIWHGVATAALTRFPLREGSNFRIFATGTLLSDHEVRTITTINPIWLTLR